MGPIEGTLGETGAGGTTRSLVHEWSRVAGELASRLNVTDTSGSYQKGVAITSPCNSLVSESCKRPRLSN